MRQLHWGELVKKVRIDWVGMKRDDQMYHGPNPAMLMHAYSLLDRLRHYQDKLSGTDPRNTNIEKRINRVQAILLAMKLSE